MADPSKSSQTAKNVVIALLLLWSIISLIVIVVWSTSPDLKSSAQCRAELQDKTEKLEGVKVVCRKDKVALEEQVEAEREEQAKQRAEILLLLGHLNATNVTLEECRQENLVLKGNVSVLQEDIEQLRLTEANLTAQLRLQEDHIDTLQENVTQATHQTEACVSLRAAAESQMLAAQSQKRACESGQQYLKKQLLKCKVEDSEAPEQTQQDPPIPTSTSAASPLSGIPALTLLVCSALRLITCEYQRLLLIITHTAL
uniref:IgA receptor n=1 Tax=Semicossyphus pulcher TaxID=241346 RepID=UPI0037E89FFF